MHLYKYLFKGFNEGWSKVEPNIFPLIQAEVGIWAIAGSETQQPTSPVFRFHEEDRSHDKFKMTIAWNSLSAMIADGFVETEV